MLRAASTLLRASRGGFARSCLLRGMATQRFPVPSMGDSITEGSPPRRAQPPSPFPAAGLRTARPHLLCAGTVLEIHKSVGDYVEMEEVVIAVETDKVTIEIRAPAAGTLTAVLAKPDETVIVGEDLLEIDVGVGSPGAASPAASAAASAADAPPAVAPPPAAAPSSPARVHPSGRPSLINFRSAAPADTPAAAPAAAPQPAAAAAPSTPTAPPAGLASALPARFQRKLLSAEEMEAVEMGGAGFTR